MWKTWEGGRVKMLVQDMNVPIVEHDTKKDRIKLLVEYFAVNRNNHQFYALKFFLCEVIFRVIYIKSLAKRRFV